MTKYIAFLIPCFYIFLFCTPVTNEYKVIDGQTQGTTYHIKYKVNGDSINPSEITALLTNIDNSMSLFSETSIISRINNNVPDIITDNLFNDVYNASVEIYKKTNGLFDITVGPIVKAWGFMPTGHIKLDSSKIDSLKQLVGMNKIKLINNKLIKEDPRIQLDVNAIAQGYTVDYIANYLESKKIFNYIIEIGGEVRARGINDKGESWKIGIDKPASGNDYRELQTIISISDKSLATSGSYRKFVEENGIKYSHTVDPKTGYPTHHNLLSVTVVTDNCTNADGYATAVMVMGLEKGKVFIENNKQFEAYFIYSDEKGELKVWHSKGLEKYLLPVN